MADRLRTADHLSISPSHSGQLSLLPLAGREMNTRKPRTITTKGEKSLFSGEGREVREFKKVTPVNHFSLNISN